jgi:hypothetical protein
MCGIIGVLLADENEFVSLTEWVQWRCERALRRWQRVVNVPVLISFAQSIDLIGESAAV